jgi:2-phosphosulfolactate phosphatase
MSVVVDAYLTPFFPEHESLFDDSIVVMIDVLRASSTVSVALKNGAKEVIPTDSLDKAVKIYSSLSKEVRFLGGERNGLKPSGFDAGNSPFEYTAENVSGRSVILTTSNGTKIFQKAKQSNHRIVGSFVNHNVVIEYIKAVITNTDFNGKIIFLCAGNDGKLSYEDMICAGAFIYSLTNIYSDYIITDPAMAAMSLYSLHSVELKDFLKKREHSIKLKNIGFEHDLDFCFSFDICPVVPLVGASSIKKYEI